MAESTESHTGVDDEQGSAFDEVELVGQDKRFTWSESRATRLSELLAEHHHQLHPIKKEHPDADKMKAKAWKTVVIDINDEYPDEPRVTLAQVQSKAHNMKSSTKKVVQTAKR